MNQRDFCSPPLLTLVPAASLSPRFQGAYQRIQQGELQALDLYLCLDHLLRLFTGLSAGLVRYLEPGRPELAALACDLDRPLQYERLLRFAIHLLRQIEPSQHRRRAGLPPRDPPEPQQLLLEVFFPNLLREDISAPLHTTWLQLGSEASSLPPLSRWNQATSDQSLLLPRYREVLEGWLQAALPSLSLVSWQLGQAGSAPRTELLHWWVEDTAIALLPPCSWEPEVSDLPSQDRSWRPRWSPQESALVRACLEQHFPDRTDADGPHFLLQALLALLQERYSAYLLLEGPQGVGKTLALSALPQALDAEISVVYFSLPRDFHGDFQTLVEELDEGIGARSSACLTELQPLGPLVLRDLNRRYAQQSNSDKFLAYLNQLLLRNGQRILLILDGLDEVPARAEGQVDWIDFLPSTLPEGVFLLLAYQPQACSPEVLPRLRQLGEQGLQLELSLASELIWGWYAQELAQSGVAPELGERLRLAGLPLLGCRLLSQALQADLVSGESLETLSGFEQQLQPIMQSLGQCWGDAFTRLLLVLATARQPVPLDELSQLGFEPPMLTQLFGQLPALFRAHPPGLHSDWGLELGHQALRDYLQQHCGQGYRQTCQQLAWRLLHQAGSAQDWGALGLESLYAWAQAAQDAELLEQIVSLASLRQLRNQVCQTLEQSGRFHHKLAILEGWQSCLELALGHQDSTELRDELAWVLNSRGLTYFHLGRFEQGLLALGEAESQFRVLVDQRNLSHYRTGLAAALNRRSQALRALGQVGEAWECAHQSVEHHRQSWLEVSPQPLPLGLARALIQRASCAADHCLWTRALGDLQEALNLLEQSTRQSQTRGNLAALSGEFQEWIRALIARAEAYRAIGEHDNALLDLDQALLLTRHAEELQGQAPPNQRTFQQQAPEIQVLQGRAYEALQGFEEALEAYDEAIVGYSQLLSQGRLDVRLALAEAHQARAELRRRRQRMTASCEDSTQALALLGQLIEGEERQSLRPFRAQTYQSRADCWVELQRHREAVQDYERAVCDFLFSLNSGKLQQPELRRLASVYFHSARLYLQLQEPSQAADRVNSAIHLLEERLGASAEALGEALLLKAQAQQQLGDREAGWQTVGQAIQVLSSRVRGGSGGSLERQLAEAHRVRAELGEVEQALRDLGLAFHLYSNDGGEPERCKQIEVLQRRAELQWQHFDAEAALEDLQQALELLAAEDSSQSLTHQHHWQLYRLRSQILASQMRWAGAISELLAALDDLRRWRAQPQLRLEALLELLALQVNQRLWPDFSVLYHELQRTWAECPDLDLSQALETLTEAILAQAELDSSLESEAVELRFDLQVSLTRQLPQRPDLLARALFERGRAGLGSQRVPQALEDLGEAVQLLRGLSPIPQRLLAEVLAARVEGLMQAGLGPQALRDVDEAIKFLGRDPGEAGLLGRLLTQKATLLRQNGQPLQVVSELTQALSLPEIQPLGPEVLAWMYLGRALAYDELRQPDRAVVDFREAAQLLCQIPEPEGDTLRERLRCRLRLLELESRSHSNFLSFCAEDSLVCVSRLRRLSPQAARPWLLPWVRQWLRLPAKLLNARLLGEFVAEVRLHLPGFSDSSSLGQLLAMVLEMAAQSENPSLSEMLLGLAVECYLAGGDLPVLAILVPLCRLYQENPQQVPTLNLAPLLSRLRDCGPGDRGSEGVAWNNVLRAWSSLPEAQLQACGSQRADWQSLRLW